MQTRLTTSSIFLSWQTPLLLLVFLGIRLASFFLVHHTTIQAILVFLIIFFFGLIFFKKPNYAWMIILGELMLGGAGHFLEFFGLAIRTILILIFVGLWIISKAVQTNKDKQIFVPHQLFYVILLLFLILLVSGIIGLFNNHTMVNVIQDIVPYGFLLLTWPAYHLFDNEKIKHYFIRLIIVFIIGSALFSLFVYFQFVFENYELHGAFYNWFRDVVMGKITRVTDFYYRVVTPADLLVTPLLLIISSLLMRDEKHHKMWRFLFICGAIVLAVNFSRAYILALAVGLVFLAYKHKFYRWIKVSLWSVIMITLVFVSINIISSKGKSLGLEIIGIRISSFVAPEIELSTSTRMALLEPIWQMIKQHLIVGHGIGASVTYFDQFKYKDVTTKQFDWGYLEMWVELGIIGLIYWLVCIGFIIRELIKKIRGISDYHDFYVGLLGGLIAMLIMNITSPILFHVLGIFYLSFIIAFISKPVEIFDGVITLLYSIFNRLKSN